jgi:hypothetical protein
VALKIALPMAGAIPSSGISATVFCSGQTDFITQEKEKRDSGAAAFVVLASHFNADRVRHLRFR